MEPPTAGVIAADDAMVVVDEASEDVALTVVSDDEDPVPHDARTTSRAVTEKVRRSTRMNTRPRFARSLISVRMGPHMLLPSDASAVKGSRMKRESLRRVWVFASP
ncbi:MAG: hypothetical protein RJA15_242, partial [Actinomycetota bacterium]